MNLDDVFHKWLTEFNIQDFYKVMNKLDPDLQFIFEELTANINFLDINLKIINDKLHFDVYTNLQILLVTVTIKVESKMCKVAKILIIIVILNCH